MRRAAVIGGAAALATLAAAMGLAQDAPRPAPAPPPAAAAGAAPAETAPDGTRRPAPRPDATPPEPANPAPKTQGRLIPPEAPDMPAPDAAQPPPEPVGPPAYTTLRESDFAFAACRLELTLLGATYREIPPLTDPDNRDCGIARPIQVDQILPGIAVQGGAPMRCDTARALAHWMRDFVLPAARHLPGAPRLTGIAPGTTYQCRGIVGGASAEKLSEHALGNAVDIAGFTFADADPVDIAPRDDGGRDMAVAFQRAARATACLYFTTVLGPGSNAAHDDHLHLDIKARNSGYRLCQ